MGRTGMANCSIRGLVFGLLLLVLPGVTIYFEGIVRISPGSRRNLQHHFRIKLMVIEDFATLPINVAVSIAPVDVVLAIGSR